MLRMVEIRAGEWRWKGVRNLEDIVYSRSLGTAESLVVEEGYFAIACQSDRGQEAHKREAKREKKRSQMGLE